MADWTWHDPDSKESIVIPSVQAIAVYTNPQGEVVIRQEGTGNGDLPDDAFVVIPRGAVGAIVKALKAEAAKPHTPK
jgi:hypothetical protein